MDIIKDKTVAFTGYRTEKILKSKATQQNLIPKIFEETYNTILMLYKHGYTTFLTGMAQGFDMLSAEAVIRAKSDFPEIELIAVIPFEGQQAKFGSFDKQRYENILKSCSESVILSKDYSVKTFFERNCFLVDNSAAIVCFYDGQSGGTGFTYNRAVKQNKIVLNIYNKLAEVKFP